LVGKYLNGYTAGVMRYVPPGWNKWFATNSGAFYNYGVTTKAGLRNYDTEPQDYSSRVLLHQAVDFVTNPAATKPFFLYFALSAPHSPAIPDPRDVGRFAGDEDWVYRAKDSSSLESAYGVDRAVGKLLANVPPNTVVLFMSDNGYMWNQPESNRGLMSGKVWPYNASIRVPIVYASLDGTAMPQVTASDIVTNVDLRTTLLHAAGLAPLTSQEGMNWFNWPVRDHLLLEHYEYLDKVTYCGIRTNQYMYARFHNPNGTYTEELFSENPVDEATDLASDPAYATVLAAMEADAKSECDPAPPGYTWSA
jgi:arylsulfatase A-like enzyme